MKVERHARGVLERKKKKILSISVCFESIKLDKNTLQQQISSKWQPWSSQVYFYCIFKNNSCWPKYCTSKITKQHKPYDQMTALRKET